MTTPTARTQPARRLLHSFHDWWKDAPLYKSIWFLPLVMVLFALSVVINFIKIMLGANPK